MVGEAIRVFIAEDSPTVIAVVKKLLATSDMLLVGNADNGKAVIEQVQKLKPDVVLMDIGLLGIDGISATITLKKQLPNLKVVMLTANESDQLLFDAFAAGADAYYLKVGFDDQLITAVRTVASNATWLHPSISKRVLQACVRGAEKVSMVGKRQIDERLRNSSVSKHKSVCDLINVFQEKQQHGAYEECESLLLAAASVARDLNGSPDEELARILTMQADFFLTREKFEEAEALYLRSAEMMERIYGRNHEQVAACFEILGNFYDTRNVWEKAEDYYTRALSVRKNVGGNQASGASVADTYSKLAWVYRAQGKGEQAEEMEEHWRLASRAARAN